jgi:hypothetical protein
MRSELALLALACATFAACAAPMAHERLVVKPEFAHDELAFWQALETQPRLSKDDALHALFLMADGSAAYASYAARLSEARRRGWIAEDEMPEPDEAATIGWVSAVVMSFLPLERGVTSRFVPTSERYATRELVFQGLLPDRSPSQPLRGLELLELAGRIDDWRAAHGAGS